jgi:hypothetical protein
VVVVVVLRVGYVGFVYLSSRKSFDSFIKSNQRRKKKNKTLRKKKKKKLVNPTVPYRAARST